MRSPTQPTFEQARTVLDAQPFSQLIGAELAAYGEGRAIIEIALRPELLQQNGVAHGGVLAYAADNVTTFAAGTALGPDVLTASLNLEYVAPAVGELLRAEAWVSHADLRKAVCHCTVQVRREQAWTTCAVAQGLIRASRPHPTPDAS